MKQDVLTYPVIVTECDDEIGHYYVVSSPNIKANIKGMVTDGKTLEEQSFMPKTQ